MEILWQFHLKFQTDCLIACLMFGKAEIFKLGKRYDRTKNLSPAPLPLPNPED